MEEAKGEEEMGDKILEPQEGDFKKKKELPTTLDDLSICLFTNTMYSTVEANLEQMRRRYGFFILEEAGCKKRDELLKFLAKLIHKDRKCIYCDQRFKESQSAQKHMISKMHCLMNSEYFGQYERFYDFKEENRRVALDLQERFKHVRTDNEYVFTIKNKPEVEAKVLESEVEEGKDEDWEDDGESEEKGRVELPSRRTC